MREDILNYAIKLNDVGDYIIEISNKLSDPNENLVDAVRKYQQASSNLQNATVPAVVAEEHRQMVFRLNQWIKATQDLRTANDLEIAITNQRHAESQLELVIKAIGRKLEQAMK